MADLSIPNDNLQTGDVILASEHNSNNTTIETYTNNRNTGAALWDAVKSAGVLEATGATTLSDTLGVTGVSTFTGGIASLLSYRRSVLTFVSVTQVDVENNTGTANQTKIIFTDGTVRNVTEDTSSANKFRRFDITATAEFTSGTEDSGLHTSLSETANTWYAIYAVKSTINTANFVMVGDTTLPLQANFSTLNSRYGTDGWIYLGLIRNGDSASATTDIVEFSQAGNMTMFKNDATILGVGIPGIIIASGTNIASLTYTHASGTGDTDIPGNITHVQWLPAMSDSDSAAATFFVFNSANSHRMYVDEYLAGSFRITKFWTVATEGLLLDITGGGTPDYAISVGGFVDNALGVGTNPLL